jgi:formylglycine-generating enzyme
MSSVQDGYAIPEGSMTRCILVWATFGASLSVASLRGVEPQSNVLSVSLGHDQKIECIWIEAGRFQMGSPFSDPLAEPGEKPQREVYIENGFYLGRRAVTFGQFQEFVLDTGYRTDAETETRPRWRGGHGFNADKNKFEGWFRSIPGGTLAGRSPTRTRWAT